MNNEKPRTMDLGERLRFRSMACRAAIEAVGGLTAWYRRSEEDRQDAIATAAVGILLEQALPEYARAQELIRACITDVGGK